MTMPCGCGGGAALTCNCVIVPGPNVTIDGTGTPENPYVVAADPLDCEAVQDCVAAALGDGLAWDAGAREISVRPSTEPGNIIAFGADGGLYASPDGSMLPPQPRARIRRDGPSQPFILNDVMTLVEFNAAQFNLGGVWNAGDPDRLTVPLDGGYTAGATIIFAPSAAAEVGYRAVQLRLNGGDVIVEQRLPPVVDAPTVINVSTSIDLAAGDYIEVLVQHTQPGSVQLLVANYAPCAWLYYTTEGK